MKRIVSEVTKEKQRQARLRFLANGGESGMLGRKQSTKQKKAARHANIGNKNGAGPRKQEFKDRISVIAQGRDMGLRRGATNSPQHNEKIRLSNLGQKRSQETIENIRRASIILWKDPKYREKFSKARKGYKETKEHKNKISLGLQNSKKFKLSMKELWNEVKRSEQSQKMIGSNNPTKNLDSETRRIQKIRLGFENGRKSWNYILDRSLMEYPDEFSKGLKLYIRNRDGNVCMLCGVTQEECRKGNKKISLCVNHINFNKKDCREENLNTLCNACNLKINGRRAYWTKYFQEEMTKRYGFKYSELSTVD